MKEQQKSYEKILKATSLFGGVQVINILVAIVRSKCIALLIGPTGMGIASLLNKSLLLINSATNLGLPTSAVKDISYHHNNEDIQATAKTISILKKLVWGTAILGALVLISTSSLLSQYAFDSREYTIAFIWLGLALFFKQITDSQLTILQGLRKHKALAAANVTGSVIGLIITVPLYYFFKLDAIVPAIIISYFLSFLISYFYLKGVTIPVVKKTWKQSVTEGKPMMLLGITLSISTLISVLVGYLVQIYISQKSGINAVGLYDAGYVIMHNYVGIIFTAMATDYFPRLAAIADKAKELAQTVYEQAYIGILLITPIVTAFLIFAQFIIVLLYSNDFLPIVKMVSWGILGMVIKAASFSVGYIIVAKGDSKLFIKTTVSFNILLLILNVAGYHLMGLEGIGISFLIHFVIHFVALLIITNYKYGFKLHASFYPIFVSCLAICVTSFLLTYISSPYIKYTGMAIVMCISFIFSYRLINKKVPVKQFLQSLLKRKKS